MQLSSWMEILESVFEFQYIVHHSLDKVASIMSVFSHASQLAAPVMAMLVGSQL